MAKARVAVLISGGGTNMAALLYAAKADDCLFELVLVASNNPDVKGLKLAESEGIPTFSHSHKGLTREAHDAIMHEAIISAKAEFVALAGYMRILSAEFVGRWAGKMLNIHPSLLPHYKGLHTHQRAIDAGDKFGGCSVHIVTEELDDGEILGQTPVAILADDTAETLASRVLIAEHQLYGQVLARFVSREQSPEYLVSQVRARAMALPDADEVVSHGMPCFGIIKGKKFAYVSLDHHGDGKTALLVKISGIEEQTMLIDADPDRYARPAYFGDNWISIRLDLGDVNWDYVDAWLRKSWIAIAPAKLARLHMLADEF